MKIFITGADGFIGSHLVELLLKKITKYLLYVTILTDPLFGLMKLIQNKVKI